jgi:putative ABC transport system permease protein
MNGLSDIFGQVFSAIWANKLRSFLTMFGIAWGVGSLLLLVGLGEGFRSGQRRQMATLGNDVIFMSGGNIPAVPSQHTGMRPYQLTVRDAVSMRTESSAIKDATAVLRNDEVKQVSAFATSGGTVNGAEPNYPSIRAIPIAQGRFLDAQDLAERRHVAVLGKKAATLLFPGHAAIGSTVLLNGSRFDVIGIFDRVGHGNNDTSNQEMYVPLTTMLEMFPMKGDNVPQDAVTSIQYQPLTHGGNIAAVADAHRIVAAHHNFDPNAPDAFDEWDSVKSEQMVDVIFNVMDYFLGGVGIVTLGLGAVGIINIMLVSVTERTREIGLRKALGATNVSIELQFLLEGLFLTGVSGLVGMGGAALLMSLMQSAFGGNVQGFDPPRLVPWSAALAIGSLSLSGIVAGLVPARQAARLEPVEALRKE